MAPTNPKIPATAGSTQLLEAQAGQPSLIRGRVYLEVCNYVNLTYKRATDWIHFHAKTQLIDALNES